MRLTNILTKWRAGRRARRSGRTRQSLTMAWLTGVLFATATALLSAALALIPAEVDNALRNGWGGAARLSRPPSSCPSRWRGLALLGWAAWRWHERGVILGERGTAYVVEEHATAWWHEEKASVTRRDRVRVRRPCLRVPGPTALDETWHWQADASGRRSGTHDRPARALVLRGALQRRPDHPQRAVHLGAVACRDGTSGRGRPPAAAAWC